MVYGLTFTRFLELIYLSNKAREEEAKERYTIAAFIGFQMGAGGKKKFGEYLRSLHLSDEPVKSEKPSPTPKKTNDDTDLRRMGILPLEVTKK